MGTKIVDTATSGAVFSIDYANFAALTIGDGPSSNTLTLDYNVVDGLDPSTGMSIAYNSSVDVAPISDTLALINGSVGSLEFNFDNLNDGNVVVDGTQTITYTGLEPISSTVTAANVTLNYSAVAETLTIMG